MITGGQRTSAGIKPENQDACDLSIPDASSDHELFYNKGVIAAIADGVSSCEAGAMASQACVQGFISDYYSTPDTWSVSTAASKIYSALNQWLLGQDQQTSGGERVTTFTTLVIKSSTAYIFHIGDSRVYHWQNGQLEQITRDHRVAGAGDKQYLGRAMGIQHHLEVDHHQLSLTAGDGFLLCTDGVHEFVSNHELVSLIDRCSSPQQIAEQVVEQAMQNGSNDNLTCQFLSIDELPEEQEEEYMRRLHALPFPPDLMVGMEIDGYRILRELHASSRSQLYLALDQHSKEEVVIKTPSVNYEDDPVYLDSFLHEEWAGSRLSSPHLVRYHDVRQRRRFLYLVTDYIDGFTLRQWIEDNPFPDLSEVRHISDQIIRGLRALHRMEMVHRDLKPENILLDNHGTVTIIDFGSMRIRGVEESHSSLDTLPAHGTRNFSAPELVRGEPGSAQSDQFSLAVILYEMLCGKLPYGDLGDHPSPQKAAARIHPHRFTALQHQTDLYPVWVGQALQKALSENPTERYPALSELSQDLKRANPTFRVDHHKPLLERDPLSFWKWLSVMLFITNLLLLTTLAHTP